MRPKLLRLERLESRALLAVYTVDFSGADANDALTTLNEALHFAAMTAEADTIEFAPALTGSTLKIGSLPNFFSDLTIHGPGSSQLTVEVANGGTPALTMSGNISLAISGVKFTPPAIPPSGTIDTLIRISGPSINVRLEDVVALDLLRSGIELTGASTGSITVLDSRLIAKGSQGSFGVGASSSYAPPTRIERSELNGFRFGGVRAEGDVTIIDSTIVALPTNSSGQGVVSRIGRVDISGSTISGFNSGGDGGGVRAKTGVSIVDSTIEDNTARSGGGIFTEDGAVTMERSTIRDNTATSVTNNAGGGALHKSGDAGNVSIIDSTISGNHATASNANGGGVFSRTLVSVLRSEFRDNVTIFSVNPGVGSLSAGGAIYAFGIIPVGSPVDSTSTIVESLFENNRVNGLDSDGGAVWVGGALTIDRSTFRNNSTFGADGDGGAVHIDYGVISNSTFVGNRTLGPQSDGAAVSAFSAPVRGVVIRNSTFIDNETTGTESDGGAIYSYQGGLAVHFSTIAGNRTLGTSSRGGGIALGDPTGSFTPTGPLTLWHTIVADNTAAAGNPDLYLRNDNLTSNYTLLESTAGMTAGQLADLAAGAGSLTGVDPQLALLADNGGPTLTRLLLAGSPALDAGDPALTLATPNAPSHDQRGVPYARLAGARADLGAVEAQPTPAYADFDHDFDVDGYDFLAWQRGLGLAPPTATKTNGDADDDHDVDDADLAVWAAQYGVAPAIAPAIAAASPTGSTLAAAAVDAALNTTDLPGFLLAGSPLAPNGARAPGMFAAQPQRRRRW